MIMMILPWDRRFCPKPQAYILASQEGPGKIQTFLVYSSGGVSRSIATNLNIVLQATALAARARIISTELALFSALNNQEIVVSLFKRDQISFKGISDKIL